VVGATAGLGWLLILTTPIAEPVAVDLPSREQLLFMLEFSDEQGEFVDPFEIQPTPESAQTSSEAADEVSVVSQSEGQSDDDD